MKKPLSKHIIKQSVKNNWKLWMIMTGVLCLFITVITLVAPNRAAGVVSPGGGFVGGQAFSLLNLYSMMFFGGIALMIVLIYTITVGNKLVASEVDRGTMSFTLNTPTTRKQIIFSKALFYITSLFLMIALMGIFGMITSFAVSMELELGKFWLMNLGLFLFAFAISGICYFASCWFNKSSQSLMIGAGLPVAFWLFDSLSKISELEFLKYFSLNTLFDTSAITSGSGFIFQFIVMAVIGIVLYAIGINKFLKKDLPL